MKKKDYHHCRCGYSVAVSELHMKCCQEEVERGSCVVEGRKLPGLGEEGSTERDWLAVKRQASGASTQGIEEERKTRRTGVE